MNIGRTGRVWKPWVALFARPRRVISRSVGACATGDRGSPGEASGASAAPARVALGRHGTGLFGSAARPSAGAWASAGVFLLQRHEIVGVFDAAVRPIDHGRVRQGGERLEHRRIGALAGGTPLREDHQNCPRPPTPHRGRAASARRHRRPRRAFNARVPSQRRGSAFPQSAPSSNRGRSRSARSAILGTIPDMHAANRAAPRRCGWNSEEIRSDVRSAAGDTGSTSDRGNRSAGAMRCQVLARQ